MSTSATREKAASNPRGYGERTTGHGLLILGVVVAAVGVLVLAVPMHSYVGGVGFSARHAADVAAPFALVIEIDPTSGTIAVPAGLRTVRRAALSFRAPVEFTVEVKADKGGPINVSVTDQNGPVAAGVTIPVRKSKQVSFTVRDELVTVQIASDTGRLRSASLYGEPAARDVWVGSAEGRADHLGYLVFAVIMVSLGGAIIACAFLGPRARTVGWVLVAATVLAPATASVVAGGRIADTEAYGVWLLFAAPVGTALATVGAYRQGTQHTAEHPNATTTTATILAIPALIAALLAAWLCFEEFRLTESVANRTFSGLFYGMATVLMAPTLVFGSLAAWMFGSADRTSRDDKYTPPEHAGRQLTNRELWHETNPELWHQK